MIAECIIFLVSVIPMGVDESKIIGQHLNCNDHVPQSMQEHASLYVEHFDKDNINTAVRIGWCESRGKVDAYRSDNGDTGLMQFVSWTWNWVAEKYELPEWDTWVVTRYGKPYTGNTSKTDIGFSFDRVQYTPYYNIMFASILAEDIYGKTQWRDWSSSEWCWGNEKEWRDKWLSEEY
jgi:hypothetical protein